MKRRRFIMNMMAVLGGVASSKVFPSSKFPLSTNTNTLTLESNKDKSETNKRGNKMKYETIFEPFKDTFGEPTTYREVPEEAYEKWRGKLSNMMLRIWRQEGWSSYMNGLISIINPDDYEDMVHEVLDGTGLEKVDTFHAITLSAFGEVELYGEKTGVSLTLGATLFTLRGFKQELEAKLNEEELDTLTHATFSAMSEEDFDFNKLFKKAIKKLGLLEENEIFGFAPAPVLGGEWSLKNIIKVNAPIYLSMLKSFTDPYVDIMNRDELPHIDLKAILGIED